METSKKERGVKSKKKTQKVLSDDEGHSSDSSLNMSSVSSNSINTAIDSISATSIVLQELCVNVQGLLS